MNPKAASFFAHVAIRVRRLAVAAVGVTVLALGIALIILPGPAFVVIPTGLAILAIEFAWARRCLCSVRAIVAKRLPVLTLLRKSTIKSLRHSGNPVVRWMHRNPRLK